MSSFDGITPWTRRKPKPSSTISRIPSAIPGSGDALRLTTRRRQRDDVEQLEDEVRVLEVVGTFDTMLAGDLAQLVERLGLEVGEVHPLVEVTGERAGVDRRVAAGREVVAPASVGRARRLAARATSLRAAAGSVAALWAGFVVHGRLG